MQRPYNDVFINQVSLRRKGLQIRIHHYGYISDKIPSRENVIFSWTIQTLIGLVGENKWYSRLATTSLLTSLFLVYISQSRRFPSIAPGKSESSPPTRDNYCEKLLTSTADMVGRFLQFSRDQRFILVYLIHMDFLIFPIY